MNETMPSLEAIRAEIDAESPQEGALLPILHRLQTRFGYVPEKAVALIAEALNIGRAEVHGVVSFYHDFRTMPAGHHVVKICRAEACQAVGGTEIAAATLERLGTVWHGTSENGEVTVEPVYCLGLCANGPAAMVDDRPMAAATAEKIAEEVAP